MQGIAGILGGKGGGAGSGGPAGAAAEPPGRAQPVRTVPAGKGPLRGWVGGGRVHGGGLCVGRSPGGRCGRAGLGGAGGEAAGGWVQGEAGGEAAGGVGAGGGGPAGPPRPKAARRAACPAGRGAGYAGAGRESVPCTGRQAARASKKLYTISLNCHLFLPKIKNCVKYCSQFADIMDASERDGVPKKGRSEP